jgi:hypothetical protein
MRKTLVVAFSVYGVYIHYPNPERQITHTLEETMTTVSNNLAAAVLPVESEITHKCFHIQCTHHVSRDPPIHRT